MYDDLLFPTDGSDATRRALEHALDIADRHGATLHVLSVVTGDGFGADVGRDAAVERAERAVATVARRAEGDGVAAVTDIRHGVPHEEILGYADDAGVDAIVMGTHGRSGFERAILGSVTERVVRSATVPVVTVRTTEEPAITDADAATDIAIEDLLSQGYEDVSLADEPYRTSGSWIVPVEGEDLNAHAHVDAGSGTVRVAHLGDGE